MRENRLEKLNKLQDLVIDKYIQALEDNEIDAKDLGSVITLLKNNKVVEDKKIFSESDLIDGLIDEI
jgi:hypothetical protein